MQPSYAIVRDEMLFKDPPPKGDCPIICFLPMLATLLCCLSLPPVTIASIPIYDFAIANMNLSYIGMDVYYPCCGKSICHGCIHSFRDKICPFLQFRPPSLKNSSRACWRNNWAGGGQTTLVQSIYWVVIISRGRGGNRIMETGSGAWVQSCSSFLG